MLVSALSNRSYFLSHLRLPSVKIELSLIIGVFSVDAAMSSSPPDLRQDPMKASSFACPRGLSASLARSFATTAVLGFAGSRSGTGLPHPTDCRIPLQASHASTVFASSARCSFGGRLTFAAYAPMARNADGQVNAGCR